MLHVYTYSYSHLHYFFFFFNDTATTEIYTLSLHDALPIFHHWSSQTGQVTELSTGEAACSEPEARAIAALVRSEEHTSELQSRQYLVCRLLLEKKKQNSIEIHLKQNIKYIKSAKLLSKEHI